MTLFLLTALLAFGPVTAQDRDDPERVETTARSAIDLQGHRGARGLLPENTIPSVLAALDLGVRTIEIDVVITSDRQVLVSHEPWMSSTICRTPEGTPVDDSEEQSFNIYQLDYRATAAFDCGSRGHPAFPSQRPTAVAKPLLRDVIRVSDGYAQVTDRPAPFYNVEIKSAPLTDDSFHPPPDSFARLVYDVLEQEHVLPRSIVQSFDPRSLRAIRSIDASVTLALLVSNQDGLDANLERLGFLPSIYSPSAGLVDERLVQAVHEHGMRLIPWTVNDGAEMQRLLRLGVDGIITDYPDIGRAVIDANATERPVE